MKNLIIIGNTSDNPVAIDIAHFCSQLVDVSDVIALKDFQNTEFCPRFISDEEDLNTVGYYLKDKTVAIVSTSGTDSRNELAMKNIIIARAAIDNGAKDVILVEPDLFYSCQDRGPREGQTYFGGIRDVADRKKFDGQPFTAYLYAELLKMAGVSKVVTVHNHSLSTQNLFKERFDGHVYNFTPADLFAHYLCNSGIIETDKIVLCAPDKGASPLIDLVKSEVEKLGVGASVLQMDKDRTGERTITMKASETSEIGLDDVEGRDVIVFDDMVRTGTTIVKCCRIIKEFNPRRIIFCVTHFHSSSETREKLSDPSIDEIVTTNSIPTILNRDTQGRLRKKIVVLKVERWIAKHLYEVMEFDQSKFEKGSLYSVDISSKNPRWELSMNMNINGNR